MKSNASSPTLKRSTALAWIFGCLLISNLPWLWMRLEQYVLAQSNNPVTVEWVTPTNGSIVSNTIPLIVNAGSSAGDIVLVQLSRDGVLLTNIYPIGKPPQNINVNIK